MLVLTKFQFWEGDWILGCSSVKFWDFPENFWLRFFKNSFGNSWGNSYLPCLFLLITLHFTCGERKISKYCGHGCRNEGTSKPVGLQFLSISRGYARTARPRATSVPTDNTTDVIFGQIYLIIDNIIKNPYFISV